MDWEGILVLLSCVLLLILFGGEPDLMDAIRQWLIKC